MPQRRVRYFDASGREVAEHEAMRDGTLRDQFSMRVPTVFRDSRFRDGRELWDSGQLLVVDARRIGGTEGNRPGYRVLDHDFGRAEREAAYAEAEAYQRDAWRQPVRDAYGAYPYSAAAEGAQCTINGAPGVLVREGGVLVCKPLAADAAKPRRDPEEGEDDDDDDMPQGELEQITTATSDRRVLDIAAMSAAHQRAMDAIYRRISEDVSQQWRSGK